MAQEPIVHCKTFSPTRRWLTGEMVDRDATCHHHNVQDDFLDNLGVYCPYMPYRFKDDDSERLFNGEAVPSLPPDILRRGRSKLRQVFRAQTLRDLRLPRSNRLEALVGDRQGQHSIRVNRQWRICFVWTPQGAMEIEINNHYER